MARNYVAQKNYRLAYACGEHPVDTRDKLVKWNTLAVGSDLQVTLQIALGIGPWHEAGLQTYNGATITDFRFAKGSPNETAADTYYPTDLNHPNAAFLNLRLPPGIGGDNDPDKYVGRFKTREMAVYNSLGVQQGAPVYSTNFADVALDGIKLIRSRLLQRIEYSSYLEWKAWCNETIPITKDGQTIYVKRFEAHLFLIPPFSLATFLNRLCQLSCTDWQWRKGKLRFMPATARASSFTYDLSQVTLNDFTFAPMPSDGHPNGVRVSWRDIEDQYIREADPVEIVRQNLLDADHGIENFLEINAGVCRRDQAERIGHYWAKVRCDLTDYAKVVGFPESFKVLPGDIVNLTHDIPGWTNKRCKVIKKEEDEEKKADGIYPVYLQLEPANPYSDTDFTPLVTRTAVSGPNPLTPPPAGTLAVAQSVIVQSDGVAAKCALLTVQFGNFGYAQTAKISWKQPGASEWEVIRPNLPPDKGTTKATFRHTTLAVGTHYFKAEIFSTFRKQNAAATEIPFVVTQSDLYSKNVNVTEGASRSNTGFNPQGVYVGLDTGIVPADRIVAEVIKGIAVNNNLDIDCNVAGSVTGAKSDPSSNGYSIFRSFVEVYNKFGVLVKTFQPDGFSGAGTLGKGTYPRKYADPFEEGYFRIIVQNEFGFSGQRFLYHGATMGASAPAPKDPAQCPREVAATPLSPATISFAGIFDFSGGKMLKIQKREIGQKFADWVDHETGITSLPFVNTIEFPANKELELVLVSSAGTRNASNIVRAKTLQVGETAPVRTAPTGLSVAPNLASPTSSLKINLTRNATDNTGIDLEINGTVYSFAANYIEHFINSLGEGVSRTVRARTTWAAGVPYSLWTDYVTGATDVTPPATTPPQNFSGTYDNVGHEADFTFNLGTAGGPYKLKISDTEGGTYADTGVSISGGQTTASFPLAQSPSAAYTKYFKLENAAGFAEQTVPIVVPILETSGAQQPIITGASAYVSGQFAVTVSGSFYTRGGTGGFTVYYDEVFGPSAQYAQTLAADQTYFEFIVVRREQSYDIRPYVMRNDVTGEPEKYSLIGIERTDQYI